MSETGKEYSRAEVAKHATESDCWIVVHDIVYDVTRFLDEHPGGGDVMVVVAGQDCSENFEDVGHSSDAREMMKQYAVGDVPASERQKSSITPSFDNAPPSDMGTLFVPVAMAVFFALSAFVWYRLSYY